MFSGTLSDWLGKRKLLTGLGYALAAASKPLFALAQGLLGALVADTAPEALRGTAFGFFHLVSGVAMLIASVLAGVLWERLGAPATFLAGAAFTLLGVASMFVMARHERP